MATWKGERRTGRPWKERTFLDLGTPEARARRAWLAADGNPALTEYPLGLMLLRGLVTAEQHEVGCYYAFLYGRAVGRSQATCAPLYQRLFADFEGPAELSEEERARAVALFRRGKNRLLAAGRRVCDATENVAVFGRFPRFLDAARRRPASAFRADATEFEAIRTGLEVLVACYGRGAGRLGHMEDYKAPSMVERAPANFSLDGSRKVG